MVNQQQDRRDRRGAQQAKEGREKASQSMRQGAKSMEQLGQAERKAARRAEAAGRRIIHMEVGQPATGAPKGATQALAKAMDKLGKLVPCFIQVNVGEEEQKGGCAISELPKLIEQARAADIPIAGLMCIPPIDEEPSLHFALLQKIATRNGLQGLSMGMSSDFEQAIREGASIVRVGSAIFGPRPMPVGNTSHKT